MGTEPNDQPGSGGAGSETGPGGAPSDRPAGDGSGTNPPDNQPGGDGGADRERPETVSRDAYDRVLAEAKAAKERARKLEDERRQEEEKALREKEDFKALAEKREQELAEERQRREKLETQWQTARKIAAFTDALDGHLDQKFFHLIDTDRIQLDDDGKADEATVRRAIESFKSEFGELVKKPGTNNLPTDAPGSGGSGSLTHEEWLKLPLPEKKKRYQEMRETEKRRQKTS